MTKICVPVRADNIADLKEGIKKAGKADLVEIWVDKLPRDLKAEKIAGLSKKKLLIVNKPPREKGIWKYGEEKRISRLEEFVDEGVAYVDVGIDTNPVLIRRLAKKVKNGGKTKLIVSYHNFKNTPSSRSLLLKVKEAAAFGADVIKLATFAKRPEDNLKLFDACVKARKIIPRKTELAFMAMGPAGILSRIAGPVLGSYLCFAAADEKSKTAAGQLTISQHLEINKIINHP